MELSGSHTYAAPIDAVLAMLAWGYHQEAKRMLVPLLDFTRQGLDALAENHVV